MRRSLLAAGAVAAAALGLILYNLSPLPGITLDLHIVQGEGDAARALSLTSRSNVTIVLMVEAVRPEGVEIVYKAAYRPPGLIYIPADKLEPVAKELLSTAGNRGGAAPDTAGLILHILVVDTAKRRVVYHVLDSIEYNPRDIASGKSLLYRIYIAPIEGRIAKIAMVEVEELRGPIRPRLAERIDIEATAKRPQDQGPGAETKPLSDSAYEPKDGCILVVIDPFTGAYQEFCYTTKLLITPEDIASTLRNQCPDCVAHMDGRIYVKLPLLVASNSHYPSGTVGVSFSMSIQDGTVGVYPVFTISDKGLIDKLLKGIIPGASLWRGEGASWKGEGRLDYAYSDNIAPGETVWFWVWARPYYIVYDVEECGIAGCNYVGEEHEMVLADIAVYGSLIRGGVERRHLPSGISDALFRGTVLRNVRVPNGFLDDGVLAPGEYELISRIIDSFDTCGIDLDMTIPVGAMAGLATCTVLGLQSQGLACLAILTFTGSFQAIVSVESSSLGVGGVIVNHGGHPHVVNDFDIVEYIYIAVSRYEYVKPRLFFGACRYSVPAGVYLEFR